MSSDKSPYDYIHPDCYVREDYLWKARETLSSLDLGPIPPSDVFSPANLMSIPEHQWMGRCKFNLVAPVPGNSSEFGVDAIVLKDPLDILKMMDFVTVGHDIVPLIPKGQESKLIAIDTETTGLNVYPRLVGGRWEYGSEIVGLCLASNSSIGYYFPIGHTESDGVPNWSIDQLRPLMQEIQKPEYHGIYFNHKFDGSVFLMCGVEINPLMTDVYLIHRLMGNYEFFEGKYSRVNNLKELSEYCLGRKMLEIHQLLGYKTKSKSNKILFNRLAATSGTVYGASDAINTFGLFEAFVLKDNYGRNPYKYQPMAASIEMQASYPVLNMVSCGIPIDLDRVKGVLGTIYRRLDILENKIIKLFGDVNVNSPEQMGRTVAMLLKTGYPKSDDEFHQFLTDQLTMAVTVREYKHVGKKITYSLADEVIQKILGVLPDEGDQEDVLDASIESFHWVPVDVRNRVVEGVRLVSSYRSLFREKNIYLGIIRSLKRDDRGYSYINYSTKMSGTDTGRFSHDNSSGIERISIMKTPSGELSCNYHTGDGTTLGINSQGFASTKIKKAKAIKLTTIPDDIKEKFRESKYRLLVRYVEDLISI